MATNKANSKCPAALAESAQPATENACQVQSLDMPEITEARHAAIVAAEATATATRCERLKTAATAANYASASASWQSVAEAPQRWQALERWEAVDGEAVHRDRATYQETAWNCEGPPIVRIVAGTVFKRLQFPKGKQTRQLPEIAGKARREASLNASMPRLLTAEDFREVFQTVAAVLSAGGFLEVDRIPAQVWFAVFRECRKALRLTRQGERENASLESAEAGCALALEIDGETRALARQRLARVFSYWKSAIAKARDISINRQRKYIYRQNHKRLRELVGMATRFSNMTPAEEQKACKDKSKLMKAVADAETAWTAEAEAEALARHGKRLQAEAVALAVAMTSI